MGSWGFEPYEDTACIDFFDELFDEFNFSMIENTILNYNNANEHDYFRLRAAAFLLQKICIPHIWKFENEQCEANVLIKTAISNLEKMISKNNNDGTFLSMYFDELGVINSVENQIKALKIQLNHWQQP